MSANYTITPAQYAKNSIAVRCPSDNGFKSRPARVVEALHGRWSNREKAYILAASKEARLRQLIDGGWDGRLDFTGDGYKTRMVLEAPERRLCPSCDGGLTETDDEAGQCTQCGWALEERR